jgi:hypothetical protein
MNGHIHLFLEDDHWPRVVVAGSDGDFGIHVTARRRDSAGDGAGGALTLGAGCQYLHI